MRTQGKRAVSAAALLLATAGAVVAGGGPASATAADCSNGANGFVTVSDNASGAVARHIEPYPEFIINLEYGTIGGVQRGFARLRGRTVQGDKVWMDWTRDAGRTWIQCGPFTVSYLFAPKTSAAQRTSRDANWRFRACGRGSGANESFCTTWW
ncbi:hypothetical protein GCM10020358_18840 [Amorphoplanes nipponensis]|uniref:Uncharacterized protein n=1 Tax=Actinoplanes nipponensis TaxID=135950 RepID=A0A919MME1_9ACTN|nr:hypothetical protein [Actinoplanes nipponensis]GIE50466.1 hypothetical protein Ani05nite_40000 [Actinoplanes nipponensis]